LSNKGKISASESPWDVFTTPSVPGYPYLRLGHNSKAFMVLAVK
jgi:hypothetical protein